MIGFNRYVWRGALIDDSWLFRELVVPRAGDEVVIDHAGGLHKGVADSGADECEAAFFERLAHGVGLGRRCGNLLDGSPMVHDWFVIDE